MTKRDNKQEGEKNIKLIFGLPSMPWDWKEMVTVATYFSIGNLSPPSVEDFQGSLCWNKFLEVVLSIWVRLKDLNEM